MESITTSFPETQSTIPLKAKIDSVDRCSACPFVMMLDPKKWFHEEGNLVYLWCRLDTFSPDKPSGEFGYTTNQTGICAAIKAINKKETKWTFPKLFHHLRIIKWIIPMGDRLIETRKLLAELEEWTKKEKARMEAKKGQVKK